jgi:hypothetical protein
MVGAVWLGHRSQQDQRENASIVVNGKHVPYAGRVPWSNAILDPRNPRRLVVFADGIHMRGRPTCVLPIERPAVHATSHQVEILVTGYADPAPPNTACAPVGPGPQPVTVTLPSPLRQRSLIDATTGLRHPAVNPATVPNLGIPVPSGYVTQPTSWDERTGIVTREWINMACPMQCLVRLQFAPPTRHAPFEQSSGMSITGHIPVQRSRATVYTYRDQRGGPPLTETALVWTRPDHSRVLVSVGGGWGRQASATTEAEAIRLARSVR